MRERIIIFLIISLSTSLYAQWNYSGSNIYYNNGNVGIGTSTPSNMQGWDKVLDVRGGPHSKILASSNSASLITAMYSHVSWMGGGGFIGTESNHNLYFNTSYDPKMVLTTAGNLGVGLFSPSQKVDVLGRVKFRALSGTSAGAWFTDEAGNESAFIGQTGAASSDPIGIWHGGAWRFAVAQNGNVGIGTIAPTEDLHVLKDRAAIILQNTNAANWSFLRLQGSGSNLWDIAQFGNNDYLEFRPNGNDEGRIVFKQSGFVGIGTTTPDSKLTVKGTIHTQEVKVDLNGSVAPDYVFEKDYPLTSLEDLKSYIDQNKHLPEVPSAKEMEKEGINLKEMNLLLLKKVEELTLHLIELKNEKTYEVELLRSQIDQLKRK